jgi:hypothetical protein
MSPEEMMEHYRVTGFPPFKEAAAQIESDGRKLARIRDLYSQYDDDTQEYWVAVNDLDAILEGGDDEQ